MRKGTVHSLSLETTIPASVPLGATDGCVLSAGMPGAEDTDGSLLVRTTARSGALALIGMHDRPEIALVDLDLRRRVGALDINALEAGAPVGETCETGEALAASPDGRRVYALCRSLGIGRSFHLRCLDIDTGVVVCDGVVDSPRKHDYPRQIVVSGDERHVFIRFDRSLAAFSLADGVVAKRLPGDWQALVWDRNGGRLLVASRKHLFGLDPAGLALQPLAALPSGAGRYVAFAQDLQRFYVGLGTDQERGTGVCLIDLRAGTRRSCFLDAAWQDVAAAPSHGRSLAFTNTAPYVLSADGESLAEDWSIPLPGPVTRAAFAPDGESLLALVPGARLLAFVDWSAKVVVQEVGLGGVPTVEAFAVAVPRDVSKGRPATRRADAPGQRGHRRRYDDALRLARYHGGRGHRERAVVLAGRAVALSPERLEPYQLRCLYSCELARFGAAIADLETILRIDPGNEWGLRKLAWIHVSEPEHLLAERAVPLARQALAVREDAESRSILAFALALQGDFEAAVASQERAYVLTPRPFHREMLAALRGGITYDQYVSNAPAHFDYRMVTLGESKVLGFRHEPVADGLSVVRVFPGTPAAAAGLRPGDLIALLDGTEIQDGLVLNRRRDELLSGSRDRMLLVVFRHEHTLRFEVVR